jgi:hypothetical protein
MVPLTRHAVVVIPMAIQQHAHINQVMALQKIKRLSFYLFPKVWSVLFLGLCFKIETNGNGGYNNNKSKGKKRDNGTHGT